MDTPIEASPQAARPAPLAFGIGLVATLAVLAGELLLWRPRSELYEAVSDVERFVFDASGGNHHLGLALCAFMLWRRRGVLWQTRERGSLAAGLVWTAAAVALAGWSRHVGALDLRLLALAVWLLGLGALLAGRVGLRAMALPAFLLVVTMPPPAALVNAVMHPMQMATAAGVAGTLDLLGIEFHRAAEYLRTANGFFYVVEGCAGLGIGLSLQLAAVFLGELLGYALRRQLALIALAVPVALVVNQLRVLMIVLWPGAALSRDHSTQGVMMVVAGTLVLALLDAKLLGRLGAAPVADDESASVSTDAPGAAPPRARLVAVAASALLFLAAVTWAPVFSPPDATLPRVASVALEVDGLRAQRSLALDREYLGSVRWTDQVYRRYAEPTAPSALPPLSIDVVVMADHRRDRRHDVFSPKVARGRPGLDVTRRQAIRLTPSGRPAQLIEGVGPDGHETIVFFRVTDTGLASARLRAILGVDQSRWHRPQPEVVVRVALAPTPGTPRPDAVLRVRRFAEAFEAALVEAELIPPAATGGETATGGSG